MGFKQDDDVMTGVLVPLQVGHDAYAPAYAENHKNENDQHLLSLLRLSDNVSGRILMSQSTGQFLILIKMGRENVAETWQNVRPETRDWLSPPFLEAKYLVSCLSLQ